MKASELVTLLRAWIAEHGDLDVVLPTCVTGPHDCQTVNVAHRFDHKGKSQRLWNSGDPEQTKGAPVFVPSPEMGASS